MRFSVRSIVVQCHIAQSVKFVVQCRQYGSALMGDGIVCRHFFMKILLDNWGFVPVGRVGASKQEPTPPDPKIPPKQEYDGIDGERDALPG